MKLEKVQDDEDWTPLKKRRRGGGKESSSRETGGLRRSSRACAALASARLQGSVQAVVDLFTPKREFVELVKEVTSNSCIKHHDFFEVYDKGVVKLELEASSGSEECGKSKPQRKRPLETKRKAKERQSNAGRLGRKTQNTPGETAVNRASKERSLLEKEPTPNLERTGERMIDGGSCLHTPRKLKLMRKVNAPTMEDVWDIDMVLSPTRSGSSPKSQMGCDSDHQSFKQKEGCEDISDTTVATKCQDDSKTASLEEPSGPSEPVPSHSMNGSSLSHPCYRLLPSTEDTAPSTSIKTPILDFPSSCELTANDKGSQLPFPRCYNEKLGCLGVPIFMDYSKHIFEQDNIFDHSMLEVYPTHMMEIPFPNTRPPVVPTIRPLEPILAAVTVKPRQAPVAASEQGDGGDSAAQRIDGNPPDQGAGDIAGGSRGSAKLSGEVSGGVSSKDRPNTQNCASFSKSELLPGASNSLQGIMRPSNPEMSGLRNTVHEFPWFPASSNSPLQSRPRTASDIGSPATRPQESLLGTPPSRDPRQRNPNSGQPQTEGGLFASVPPKFIAVSDTQGAFSNEVLTEGKDMCRAMDNSTPNPFRYRRKTVGFWPRNRSPYIERRRTADPWKLSCFTKYARKD